MKVELKIEGERFNNRKLYTLILGDDGETEIDTLVTFNPDMVDFWVDNVLDIHNCRAERLIVGLSVERSPDRSSAATLQLCVGGYCLLYQICHATDISRELIAFLGDTDFTFVGVGVEEDAEMLWDDFSLRVVKTRDLRPWAAEELGMEELNRAGLKHLAKEVVGVGEDIDFQPESVACSRWNSRVLSRSQVTYACLDAYFSFEIGRQLSAWY